MFLSSSSSYLFFLLFFSVLLSVPPSSLAQKQEEKVINSSFSDFPWSPNQKKILVSPNSTFAAGFQPLPNSSTLYIFSIWYYKISVKTVVWSANNYKNLVSPTSVLFITPSGQLWLNGSSGQNLWPLMNSSEGANSGNLTLREDGNLKYGSWESFGHPTNTILPNQFINGKNLTTKNGKYMFDSKKLVYNGTVEYGNPSTNAFWKLDHDGKVYKENDESFITSDFGENKLRRLTLDENGNLLVYSFSPSSGQWIGVWQEVFELCKIKGTCGPNSICTNYDGSNVTACVCPPGYVEVPDSQEKECKIKIQIKKDRKQSMFLRLDYVNFTGGSNTTDLKARDYKTCESQCLDHPNCFGFLFKYDGSGYCVLQLDRLLYGYWSPGTEAVTFLRVDKSETEKSNFTGMTDLLETTCPIKISLLNHQQNPIPQPGT